ncbi:MAG: hypothetical protein ACLQVI_03255 [Polyangiaceae bacterium]|jgi:hypothetical protein
MERGRCIVLVPFRDHVEAACEEGLRGLESRGYKVRRVDASAAIDRARSELATQALADGFEELMWIDSDIAFDPDAVDRLRSHGAPIMAGLFAKRGVRQFGCFFLDDTEQIVLGEGGGPVEVKYIGTAFLLTHRRVYEDVARAFDLPVCNARVVPAVPYFLPMVVRQEDGGFWYLSEAWSFCERARQAGHKVMVDTSVRLLHLGRYGYGWEDVGAPITRTKSATLRLPKRGG